VNFIARKFSVSFPLHIKSEQVSIAPEGKKLTQNIGQPFQG
jgi:hypothetical protein